MCYTFLALWLQCYTQEEIAKITEEPQRTISDIIKRFSENGKIAESAKMQGFTPQLYNIWNFARNNNETAKDAFRRIISTMPYHSSPKQGILQPDNRIMAGF